MSYSLRPVSFRSYVERLKRLLQRIPLIRFLLSGTLTVEQIYQDRDKFATLVREVAAPDVGRMGIEILSFTIKVPRSEFLSVSAFNSRHDPSTSHAAFASALTGCV